MPRNIGSSTRSAIRGLAVTTGVEFPRCMALLCSADITATVTFADDGVAVANVPLQKGLNPIQATKVTFASGTIIALYN